MFISGDKARLAMNLAAVTYAQGCKLRFWVHMKGDDIEVLYVKTRTKIGGTESTRLTLTSNFPEWTLQEVSLSSSVPFQVCVLCEV